MTPRKRKRILKYRRSQARLEHRASYRGFLKHHSPSYIDVDFCDVSACDLVFVHPTLRCLVHLYVETTALDYLNRFESLADKKLSEEHPCKAYDPYALDFFSPNSLFSTIYRRPVGGKHGKRGRPRVFGFEMLEDPLDISLSKANRRSLLSAYHRQLMYHGDRRLVESRSVRRARRGIVINLSVHKKTTGEFTDADIPLLIDKALSKTPLAADEYITDAEIDTLIDEQHFKCNPLILDQFK